MKKTGIMAAAILLSEVSVMAQTFTLKSNELGGQFTNKQYLNGMGYTGENQSPQLYWENPPCGTKSFAVTMYDLDAPTGSGFWHWVVFNIPADITELKSGAGDVNKDLMPAGAIQSNTDMGVPGYAGAAPTEGALHRYVITVYAVDKMLDLDKNATPAYVGFNLHFSTLAKASLLVYGQKTTTLSPTLIAENEKYVWNGAVISPDGRLFASMPCWLGPTPGVVEIMKNGSFKPYPGGEWNQWQRDKDPLKSFVDVNSIFIDKNNHMWVNDAAAPDFGKAIPGAIKVVEIDLNTDKVVRSIVFDPETVGSDTRLAHIRIWKDYAILAESKSGSFIIIDLKDNSYRRILTGNKDFMLCQPEDVPVIEGRKMRYPNGKNMYINNDLVELDEENDTLYFMCLFGSKMFKINAADLTNPSYDEKDILQKISVAYDFKGNWVAGICRDAKGNFYFTDAANNGVRKMDKNGYFSTLVSENDIIWPIAPSIDKDGFLYFTSSQLNRFPLLNDNKNTVEKPWKMWKINVVQD